MENEGGFLYALHLVTAKDSLWALTVMQQWARWRHSLCVHELLFTQRSKEHLQTEEAVIAILNTSLHKWLLHFPCGGVAFNSWAYF